MNKWIPFLILSLLIPNATFAQTFSVGHISTSFTDSSRTNRNITAEIYYPSNTAGDNVAIASGQFPVLVFGHGFVMVWSAYDVYWNFLVPKGYIMVFPTTETSISPSHLDFGKDIAFLSGAMKKEGLKPASPFYGSITSKSAAMGHSMGGGSAFLSIQFDTTITALATMAAAVTTPSSITAARTITKPSIVFSGVNDCVAPPAANQTPMYDTLHSSCKTLIKITGASHCQFADINTNCYFGEGTCTPQATISASAEQTTTFNILLPWLNFYLKDSCASAVTFQNLIAASTGITSQQNCTLACSTTGIVNELNSSNISIVPNPFSSQSSIIFSKEQKNTIIRITNVVGKEIKSIDFTGIQCILEKGDMNKGIYFVQIIDAYRIIVFKKIIIQ